MVRVTRLDGSSIVVNVDLVQWVERTPDTVLSLTSGEKLPVRETPEQFVAGVVEFKRAIYRGAYLSDLGAPPRPAEEQS
jgi:flagellar protein FlbD